MQNLWKAFLEVKVHNYDNKYKCFYILLSCHGARGYDIHLLKITKSILDVDM